MQKKGSPLISKAATQAVLRIVLLRLSMQDEWLYSTGLDWAVILTAWQRCPIFCIATFQ